MSDFMFQDTKDRVWDLKLNLRIARAIDDVDFKTNHYYEKDFSFIKPEKEFLAALVSDSSFMVAMAWAIVLPQVRKMFITTDSFMDRAVDESDRGKWFDEHLEEAELEFVEGIDGEVLGNLREAFWRSLGDFFRDQKTVLQVLLKQRELAVKKLENAVRDQETFLGEVVEKALAKDVKTMRANLMKDLNIREEFPGETSKS